jgi:predicted transcriptional regulator of viral defense system
MIHKRNNPGSPRLVGAEGAAKRLGMFRARDFVTAGYPREYLRRLVARQHVRQISRGLYASASFEGNEHQTLVEAAKRVPAGVVCLVSALSFHQLGTQLPSKVWLAIPQGTSYPRVRDLPVRFYKFSRSTHALGIEEHHLPGGTVRVYSPAKTVVDCFKFRNKIGTDVAIEALSDCLRKGRATVAQINECAVACRVAKVMRPYMEAMQ